MRARARAGMWETFVDQSLTAIYAAMTVLASKGLGSDHELEASYWRNRKRKVGKIATRIPAEDSITDVLTRALELVRERSAPTGYLRRHEIAFIPQQPRKIQSRLGSSAQTTDIQVRSLKQSMLDLRIEAKVLFDGADVTHYCGDKGLLRFSDTEPYTDKPVGMMIGYSLREEAGWMGKIEAKSVPSAMVRSFEDVTVAGRTLRMSMSTRPSSTDVAVIHLLLPFNTDPDCR